MIEKYWRNKKTLFFNFGGEEDGSWNIGNNQNILLMYQLLLEIQKKHHVWRCNLCMFTTEMVPMKVNE